MERDAKYRLHVLNSQLSAEVESLRIERELPPELLQSHRVNSTKDVELTVTTVTTVTSDACRRLQTRKAPLNIPVADAFQGLDRKVNKTVSAVHHELYSSN